MAKRAYKKFIHNYYNTMEKFDEKNHEDVKRITQTLLDALGMTVAQFSDATGITYMRCYDLWRGRTKKFNPAVVNIICEKFPHVNKQFLYSGEGEPLDHDKMPKPLNPVQPSEMSTMMTKLLDMQKEVNDRAAELATRERELLIKELELVKREHAVAMKEKELGIKQEVV